MVSSRASRGCTPSAGRSAAADGAAGRVPPFISATTARLASMSRPTWSSWAIWACRWASRAGTSGTGRVRSCGSGWVWLGCGICGPGAHSTVLEGLRIVTLGSSSTEDIGVSAPAIAYPAQLQRILDMRFLDVGTQVINRGMAQEVVAGNLVRLDRDVLSVSSDLVIWQVEQRRDLSARLPVHHGPSEVRHRPDRPNRRQGGAPVAAILPGRSPRPPDPRDERRIAQSRTRGWNSLPRPPPSDDLVGQFPHRRTGCCPGAPLPAGIGSKARSLLVAGCSPDSSKMAAIMMHCSFC
jgi:hypothetical protein